MDELTWVDFVTAGTGVVGAVVAVLGAIDARRARRRAVTASTAAGEHEAAALRAAKDSADASLRSANAAERQAAAAEAALEARDPWSVERVSSSRWKVTNRTGYVVTFTNLVAEPNVATIGAAVDETLPPGGSIYVTFAADFESPASVSIGLHWYDAGFRELQFTFDVP